MMTHTKPALGEIARQHDLDALTGLRFAAAAAVFAAHFFTFELWIPQKNGTLTSVRNAFVLSVYVFFILSGFILTIAYERMESSRPSWVERKKFWIARFARMYPVYLLSIVWFAPFALRHRFLTEPFGLAAKKAAAAWFASLFLVQSWISDRFGAAWNGPTWTLSVEAGFYIAFPWLLRAILRLSTASLMAAAAALCVLAGWILTEPQQLMNHLRSPLTCMPTFVLGIVAARLYQRCHALPANKVARLFPVPAVAWIGAMTIHLVPWHGLFPSAMLILCMALLIYGLASQGWPARWFRQPTMMLLGEASYSFYLLQFPVYYTALWVWLHFTKSDLLLVRAVAAPQRHFWGFLVLLFLNQGVALLAFLYVERPLRATLRKRLATRFVGRQLPKPAVS